MRDADVCVHGLIGACLDCAPLGLVAGEPDQAAPHAHVLRARQGPWVVVRRFRSDGALDWFTWHLTRWGARRAVDAYLRNGTVKGLRP